MGQKKYFSTLQYCKAVIGNSSSGIIEAPSFRIPTVNIGDRQKGRIFAKSVIQCGCEEEEIVEGIKKALSESFKKKINHEKNPYEGTEVSKQIVEIIEKKLEENISLKKAFYNI